MAPGMGHFMNPNQTKGRALRNKCKMTKKRCYSMPFKSSEGSWIWPLQRYWIDGEGVHLSNEEYLIHKLKGTYDEKLYGVTGEDSEDRSRSPG